MISINAFGKQINYFVNIKIKGNIIIERIYVEYMPAPFHVDIDR